MGGRGLSRPPAAGLSAESGLPAYFHFRSEVHRLERVRSWLKITDIEVGETVLDEAVHGSVSAVRVLVDQPRDEVGGESDHKRLGTEKVSLGFIQDRRCGFTDAPRTYINDDC